jgi:hypothetical protein
MSVMLFKLRRVEDDEAGEIRVLLTEHDIDFYETSNGRWGLGYAAIWLHDDEKLEEGKALIVAYQQQRFKLAREAYAQLCLEGNQPTLWKIIKARPLQVIFVLIAVVIVSLFVLTPFLML